MSQTQFYTHENVSLEKNISATVTPVRTKVEDLDYVYDLNKCEEWIKSNKFQKVCLQFPDYLLPDSSDICLKLQSVLNQTIYILGDTAYESCCIDYIAAGHVNADAIIHFGPVCFSKTSANIPYLNIYEKHNLDIKKLEASFKGKFENETSEISILIDSIYIHCLDNVNLTFKTFKNVIVQRIDEDPLIIEDKGIIFLGTNTRKLTNIELTFHPNFLYYFDGESIKEFETEAKVLKRRNFLIEKIRDSKTIGIVIGTLCVQNYLKIIDKLKNLIKARGKKYYLISVGKPTVAKLANFEEIEIYVIVTCSLSEIYENRDFYRPVVTPYDVEAALDTNKDNSIKFSYDYNKFVDAIPESFTKEQKEETLEADVSLLTNRIRSLQPEDESNSTEPTTTQLALKPDGTMMLKDSRGAEFLSQRSWKGLERDVEIKEAELAHEGRLGTAMRYENEPK